MIGTYPDQRRSICDHLYRDHGGHFILTEANRDLFGAPIVGGGYLPIRSLNYDEAMTIRLTDGQGLLSVYPVPTRDVFGSQERKKEMKDEFFGKKDEVSLARSLRLAVIQSQYAQGNLTAAEAKELLTGPLDPDDQTTVYDDSDCLVVLEDFFEAVRNDPDITPEQKAYWAEIQQRSAT